jgi:hypothetical protein
MLSTELKVGFYTQTLRPGEVYEVRAFRLNLPRMGMSDAEMARWALGEVIVHALQLQTTLETDFNERVGGTFYRYSTATAGTPTHAIMEIGRDRPVANAADFRTMPNPIMTVTSFASAELHNLTTDKVIFDLLPEDRAKLTEARFALIRLSDSSGGWQQIERTFKTLDRKLTIDFTKVDAQSIGEPPSETEGEMRFKLEVWDHNGQNWRVVQAFEFQNDYVTLKPFDVRNFVLNPVVVIGPRPVGKEAVGLAFHVHELDPWPFADEYANSLVWSVLPEVIRVGVGEGVEDQPLNFTLHAAQQYDPFDPEESLIVAVRVDVKVEHVPA